MASITTQRVAKTFVVSAALAGSFLTLSPASQAASVRPGAAGAPASATVAASYSNCASGGPTAADSTMAAQLAPQINTGRMNTIDAGQVSCARVIATESRAYGLDKRAADIAITAAMTESTLHNYTVATDHDSLGLFQMRPSSGWGTTSQVTDPIYETDKFLSVMKSDYPNNAWESGDVGSIDQTIEVSAVPDAYDEAAASAQIVTNAVWAAATAPAGSSAVIGAAGSYHVFSVNGDGTLYQGYYTSGNAWSWQSLGGTVTGTPAVTYTAASNRYDVFAVGTNGVMYQQIFSGGTWSGWNAIGGSNFLGGVSATIAADGSYHVFAINASHVLYQGYYTVGNGWSWQSLGGTVFGTPAVTYRASGNRYDVFAAGTSGAMYQKIYSGGTWSDWSSIGGSNFGTGASAVYASNGSYHLFTINTSGVAYQALYTSSNGWSWQSLGGTVAGTPGVTYIDASNRFDLFAPSPNTGSMYQQIYSGGTWGGWNSIGGSNFN